MKVLLLLLKYLLVGVVGVITLVVGGLALLWASGQYKWGWIEVPVHYRLSFEVEAGGVAYTGSTVVQVTYTRIPKWAAMSMPTDSALYQGQAAVLKLNGKAICLMPGDGVKLYGKRLYSVPEIADRLLSAEGPGKGSEKEWGLITVDTAAHVSGSTAIPLELLPAMVVFDDPANPASAHIFDPGHPERSLGVGARFLGAQIAVTDEPRSAGIENILTWLNDPGVPQMLSRRDDPFTQENHGWPLYKAFFY